MYKESYYNYFLEIDEVPVLVNLRTGAIAEVKRENVQKIKEILKGNIVDEELFEQLKYGGYIVEEGYNEYEEIKMRNYKARFDNSKAMFTIIPTFQCNFDCIYCYETKRNKIMTIEKAEEIADYIINISKNKKTISIGWFGGEPLMNFKVIEHINMKIIGESEAELFSSMSSNGYLLNYIDVSKFDELKIKNVQITLDGIEETHNKYRPLIGGGKTFDKIIKGIEKLFENTEKTNVSIRVNVGPENYDKIEELFEYLEKFPKERMKIYFRWIFQASEKNKDFHVHVRDFRKENSFTKLSKLYEMAINRGYKVMLPILNGDMYCEFDNVYNMVIGPEGEIYPCTVAVEEGMEMGKIENGKIKLETKKHLKWHSHNGYEDKNCKECKILPLCHGGCRNAALNGNRGCPEEKRETESFIKLWYKVKKFEKKMVVR
ncbi:hypothetical protein LN42_08055 [Marinitoga sp. 1137]|nr:MULTISPECIES: radical SAM protein [Marinitoga]APT76338.1 hypothetical protein LN42_08055 [Marinitoga sp. 1137]